ncbi:hypothetical protein ACA910_002408 [Epithemia clementina (nom. ined.)]
MDFYQTVEAGVVLKKGLTSSSSTTVDQEAPRADVLPARRKLLGSRRPLNKQLSLTNRKASQGGDVRMEKQKSVLRRKSTTAGETADGQRQSPVQVVFDPWSKEEIEKASRLWDLSAKQKEQLVLLGKRLSDICHQKNTPFDVIRFMEARPKSLDAAEKMFRNMIEWRIKNKVDSILEDYEPPRLIRDYIPGAILVDYDRDGDPVYVERIGSADSATMVHRFGSEHLIKHAIWIRETISRGSWVKDYEQRMGHPVKQILVVEDLKGLSSAHLDRQLLAAFQVITRLDQDNYPEVAKKIINVNSPFIFRLAWSLVKHCFDHNVTAKMVFVGPNNTEKVLEKYVDLTVLPKEIAPVGQGKAAPGLPQNFTGGPLPPPSSDDLLPSEQHKGTDSDSGSSYGTPERQRSFTDFHRNNADLSSVMSKNSLSSQSHKRPYRVRTYLHEQQQLKIKRKEQEIQGVREMATKRIQPKERSIAQQQRLDTLRAAKSRRLGNDDGSAYSGVAEKRSLSDRMTSYLLTHDAKTRLVVMLFLLALFFALLNPHLIHSALDRTLAEEPSVQYFLWKAAPHFGLALYMLICAIVHFLTCDLAMVYAYNSLSVGSKTGATMKKYYNDIVRALMVVISGGIYVLSFGKAAMRVILDWAFAHVSLTHEATAKRIAGIIERVYTFLQLDERTCASPDGFDYHIALQCLEDSPTVVEDLAKNISESTAALKDGINAVSSWIDKHSANVDTTSWQSDVFGTARIFYSYTAVFLLAFLLLFLLTAHWALPQEKGSRSKYRHHVETETRHTTEPELQVSHSTPADTSTIASGPSMAPPPSLTDEYTVASRQSLSSTSTKRRRIRLRLFGRKRRGGRLASVQE